MRHLGLIGTCAMLLTLPAHADDSSAALGAGGLVLTRSADIRMADERLFISPKAVSVRFVFMNESGRDIDALTAFVLPDIDTSEYSESALGSTTQDSVNFMAFKAKADGALIAVQAEQRAFLKGKDVTEAVRAAGAPLNPINDAGFKALQALSPAQRKALADAGLADIEDPSDTHPLWTVRTRFYWTQHFPAGKPVVLEQAYQPVTGQSMLGPLELAAKKGDQAYFTRTFCLDELTRAKLARIIAATSKADPANGGYLAAYTTDYVLTTGNNWKGPIGHFHLTLDKLSPENVLSLCWNGALTRTGPTTFDADVKDLAPAHDIQLLVVAPPAK